MDAVPVLNYRRTQKAKYLGMRQKMYNFALGQIVFLLADRDVTPGHLRAGTEGRVVKLDGDSALVLFRLGAINHPELLRVFDVGWVADCDCRGTGRRHRVGCALDMSAAAMNPGDPEVAELVDRKVGL